MYVIMLHGIIMLILQGDTLLEGLEESGNHTGKVHMAREFKQQRPILSTATHKELNVTNNHVSLEVSPSPAEPQMGPQPWPTP